MNMFVRKRQNYFRTFQLFIDSKFRSVLLVPEYGSLSTFSTSDGRVVQMITVVPLFPEEHQLAATQGMKDLLALFDQLGIGPELDPGRANAGKQ